MPVELSVFQILVWVVTCQSSSELCCECVQEHCHVFIMPHQIYSEVNIGAINHVSGCWVAKILVGGHVLVTGVVVLTENFLTEFFFYYYCYFFEAIKSGTRSSSFVVSCKRHGLEPACGGPKPRARSHEVFLVYGVVFVTKVKN